MLGNRRPVALGILDFTMAQSLECRDDISKSQGAGLKVSFLHLPAYPETKVF